MDTREVIAFAVVAVSSATAMEESRHLHATTASQVRSEQRISRASRIAPLSPTRILLAKFAGSAVPHDAIHFSSRCTDCDQMRPVVYDRETLMALLESGDAIPAVCVGCAAQWSVDYATRVELIRGLNATAS